MLAGSHPGRPEAELTVRAAEAMTSDLSTTSFIKKQTLLKFTGREKSTKAFLCDCTKIKSSVFLLKLNKLNNLLWTDKLQSLALSL